MDHANPYSSPSIPADYDGRTGNPSRWRAASALLAICLAMIVPGLVVLSWVAPRRTLPPPTMRDVYFNIIFWLTVFLLTMLSVPFGFVGVRSKWKSLAYFAIGLGLVGTAFTFYIKFYPVL
jgi:hypothetical protein